ncbi:MAG: 50S ribosomal protein L11 methyltransferase [Capsulimonadaceae bacterium]
MMRWAQVTVEAGPAAVDAVCNCLVEIGCAGTLVEDQFDPFQISGYVPVDDRLELRIDRLGEMLPTLAGFGVDGAGTEITLRYVEEDDWANAWKAFFKPIRVGRRLVVTPPWETPPNLPDDITIIMDPGMAFGTGSHPTTRLCLAAIEDFLRPGNAVADIGSGSGILAIAAARLGAVRVAACDIDPLAVEIAGRNAKVNDVEIALSEGMPAGQFDLVVANILADVIIGMAGDLAARVAEAGTLIVSGIIDTREDDVRRALTAHGLEPAETRREGEWVAIVLRQLARSRVY